jgi:hypothetical protein
VADKENSRFLELDVVGTKALDEELVVVVSTRNDSKDAGKNFIFSIDLYKGGGLVGDDICCVCVQRLS